MRRSFKLFVIFTLVLGISMNGLVMPTAQAATSFYVSPTGSDANPGTLASPFRTVQKCANVAQAGDTCYIRGGTYRETVTPANSGTSSLPITYAPYNNESVTISGADIVGGWSVHSGSVYKTTAMNWDLGLGRNQIFVDGVMVNEARWPNMGVAADASHPVLAVVDSGTSTGTTGTVVSGTLQDSALGSGHAGAKINIAIVEGWVMQTGMVTASSAGSLSFDFYKWEDYYGPKLNQPYFLWGKLSLLDAPNETFYDSANSTLYLQTSQNDHPSNHTVEAKKRQYAFDLNGRSHTVINGIHLFAASIRTDASSTNIKIDGINAKYISHGLNIDDFPWQSGINDTGFQLYGSNHTLQNSRISFSSGNGVVLLGTNHLVSNNIIRDVNYAAMDSGAIHTGLTGVSAASSGHQILNNTLYNSGRSVLVHRNATNMKIKYNDIYHGGIQVHDMGLTYTYGTDGGGTELAYNLIHDNVCHGHCVGLYLDNGSHGYIVHHNVVWNAKLAMQMNASNMNNKVYNNTLIGYNKSLDNDFSGDLAGSELKNNIFNKAVEGMPSYVVQQNNIYQGTDPKFVSPLTHNYTLQSTSPAINAGQVLSPYTNGYSGSAPDIGAYEYGLTPWTAGANINLPDTSVPTAPANLMALSRSTSRIDLKWTESTDDMLVKGYKVYRNGVEIGTTSALSYTDQGLSASTVYSYTVKAVDSAAKLSADSNTASATTDAAGLPSPWVRQDIGNVGIASATTYNTATNAISVQAAGNDMWGTADQFSYLYKPLSGDGEMVLRVNALDFTDENARAGIMIRESLSTNAANAIVYMLPQGKVQYTSRMTAGGLTDYAPGLINGFPVWLKLSRTGNVINAYQSENGVNWSLIKTETIPMANNVYIGMAVLSKDPNKLTAATFDNITVSGGSNSNSGSISREYWTGVTGSHVGAIPLNSTPTGTSSLTSLEGPSNWADNYGTRIRGYITPTATGSYTFNVAGDDDSELWLSTDSNPANKVKIASVSGWTNPREWTKYPSQQSTARSLTAGQSYYVEVLHKEGGGGDNIAVGWTGPGISTTTVIAGNFLTPFTGSTDTQAPTAPTNLTSPSKTSTSVNLSWTASTDNVGVTGYEVYNGSTLAGSTSGTTFTASGLTASTTYSFTVKAKDAAGNLSTASNTLSVTTNAAGSITREYWSNLSGYTISDIPLNTAPTGTSTLTSLEGPTNWADNYGTRIRGYITPLTTGSYTFYIAGDDDSELWLSTDSNPANKVKIASVSGWTNPQEWTKYPSQQSSSRSLTAGQDYYIEVLHKENAGGDNVAVGWTGPGIAAITVIPGSYLSPYASGSDTQAPTAPTNLTSPSKTSTSVNLTWTASTDNVGVTGYDVYNGSTLAGSTSGTTFTASGLTASTTYIFTVKAKDAANNISAASSALSVTTNAPTTTIVNDHTTGTGNNQFEYVGTWPASLNPSSYQGDNHYSNGTNHYYQVDFHGTQIKLYSEKYNNMGVIAVSIDGGPETTVDLYSTTRLHNTLVYTSPVLASGQHTLKVRVTGTKHNSATNTYHVADRVDIIHQ